VRSAPKAYAPDPAAARAYLDMVWPPRPLICGRGMLGAIQRWANLSLRLHISDDSIACPSYLWSRQAFFATSCPARAKIKARAALSSGCPSRARQHLGRAADALLGLWGEPQATVATQHPVFAFAQFRLRRCRGRSCCYARSCWRGAWVSISFQHVQWNWSDPRCPAVSRVVRTEYYFGRPSAAKLLFL